jgi:c-di-GMP-binding flagellar brake protein YcgR
MSSTEPNSPSERRRHLRIKGAVEVEIQLENRATPLRAKTADLSVGGCYIEMMFTLEVGTKLKLTIWGNDTKLSADGVVATRDLQVGNGIKFTGMTAGDSVKLQQIIAAIADASGSAE